MNVETTLVARDDWDLGAAPTEDSLPYAENHEGMWDLYWADGAPEDWPNEPELARTGEIDWPFGSEDIAPAEALKKLGFTVVIL